MFQKRNISIALLIVFINFVILINGQGCSRSEFKGMGKSDSNGTEKTIINNPISGGNGEGYSGIIPILDGIYGNPNDETMAGKIPGRNNLNIASTFVHFNSNLFSADFKGVLNLADYVDGLLYLGQDYKFRDLSAGKDDFIEIDKSDILRADYNSDYVIFKNQIYLFYKDQPKSFDDLIEPKIICRKLDTDFIAKDIQTGIDIVVYERSKINYAKVIIGKSGDNDTFTKYSSLEIPINTLNNGQQLSINGEYIQIQLPGQKGLSQNNQVTIQFSDSLLDDRFDCLNEKL